MAFAQRQLAQRSHLLWHLVFFAGATTLFALVLRGLSAVLTPVAAALVLSYLLDPVVSLAERRFRVARWLGTSALFVAALVLSAVFVLLVVPLLVREIQTLALAIPSYVARVSKVVVPWAERTFNVQVPHGLMELSTRLGADASAIVSQLLAPLGGVAGKLARSTASVLAGLSTLLLIPVFTFYFLPQFPQILAGARALIPPRHRASVDQVAREIDRVLAAWIRGQLTVMACLALAYSVGLLLVGVKLALLIGLTAGLLAFIPYVGFTTGLAMAVVVCLLEYQGPGQLIGVAVVFGIAQLLEGFVLTPRIVGDKVGLGPIGVLLALMIGGHLFGFVGVLLAVPTAASVAVLLRHGIRLYRTSSIYQD